MQKAALPTSLERYEDLATFSHHLPRAGAGQQVLPLKGADEAHCSPSSLQSPPGPTAWGSPCFINFMPCPVTVDIWVHSLCVLWVLVMAGAKGVKWRQKKAGKGGLQ